MLRNMVSIYIQIYIHKSQICGYVCVCVRPGNPDGACCPYGLTLWIVITSGYEDKIWRLFLRVHTHMYLHLLRIQISIYIYIYIINIYTLYIYLYIYIQYIYMYKQNIYIYLHNMHIYIYMFENAYIYRYLLV